MSQASLFTDKQLLVFAVVGIVAVWYVKNKVVETATEAAQAVNPVNPDNIINRGFSSLYESVMGEGRSLGSDIYDWTH